ncbi:uncharacterized protein CIMG_13354 [Coccidioides immitis RS]|uniref:Uncharacterized protein n=1 Tax=Coccidioides immitis (strain RS) TaxID=246410 RepID=A0A0D8JVJ3_COCIM|nr:uncharacterized protein CIMG_13354 [Coccidioides immitis RS]KJF60961.1 hypothetical protein CIMG_13354 [Coccidioides immitis RS]
MEVVSFENSRLFNLWNCLGLPTWRYCAFTFVGTLLLLILMEFSFAAGNDHFQRKFEGLLEPGYRRDIDKAYPAILFWYGTDLSTRQFMFLDDLSDSGMIYP